MTARERVKATLEKRIEKAVLNVLDRYDGVPLFAHDVAAEAGLPLRYGKEMLLRLWGRFIVQRRVLHNLEGNREYAYWIGFPKL